MYYRIIRNDLAKSKLISLTTMIFVAAAAMLVSLAAILVVNLSGAINTFMTQAKTPHVMQMHSGPINKERLANFAEQNSDVEQYQVLEFLNVDSAQIVIDGNSLAGSVQDNGFSTQSKQFDYLLDLEGKIINVSDGELYVPISYMKDGSAQVGSKVMLFGKELTVAGFLRDSQMNSPLASSKRFLVSEHDYASIRNLGSTEYLIEFRLKELSALGQFETAYTSAGLEANGPMMTYPLYQMINAMSDGLMIAVILLVSVLVVAIAWMCIRFTLLAKIEEDYREIGVMKAIGLRVSDIKKIYLAKYAAMAAVGSTLGFAFSFLFKGILLENIRLYMGESDHSSAALLFGVVGVLLVFLTIIAYVNGVLNRFRKISATEAIRFGTSQEKSAGAKHVHLSTNKLLSTNIFLGLMDILTRKRLYITMLVVLILSTFIMLVPLNLFHTISSNSFIAHMGIGNSDMRIDIQQTDRISEKAAEIAKVMESDSSIAQYVVLTTNTFKVRMKDSAEKRIKVELGDHSIFPVQYTKGKAPAADGEIALSTINADELGKKIGDHMTLIVNGVERSLMICGIYSDVTNGGKTAKAVFTDRSSEIMWSVISAELSDKSRIGDTVARYAEHFDYAKVSGIDEYITQTFSSTISSIGKASFAAIVVALIITLLITLLFMNMLITKDAYAIAVMKAIGFTFTDIKTQYISRSAFLLFVSIVLGTLLAKTLGERLVGAVISSFGASSFTFVVNPLWAYAWCPLMMICSVLAATHMGISRAGHIRISEHIKE